MEWQNFGMDGELSTLVSGRLTTAQMVKCITCKMMGHTLHGNTQVGNKEILLALEIQMFDYCFSYI